MKQNNRQVFGILGGMGPAATSYLFQKIISLTPVKKDQDHLHVVINNYPNIPDRTQGILGSGHDPLPFLLEGLKLLNKVGVDYILMPCNTAHYYLPWLKQNTKASFIDMIELTANYINSTYPSVKKVGLLATEGTMKTYIYGRYFDKYSLDLIKPSNVEQGIVTKVIYGSQGVKSGFLNKYLLRNINTVINNLITQGAEVIILGCTELPLLFTDKSYKNVPVINPVQLLAEKAIELAYGRSVSVKD